MQPAQSIVDEVAVTVNRPSQIGASIQSKPGPDATKLKPEAAEYALTGSLLRKEPLTLHPAPPFAFCLACLQGLHTTTGLANTETVLSLP